MSEYRLEPSYRWFLMRGDQLIAEIPHLEDAEFILRAFERRDSVNAIITLGVYKWGGTWVFDDPDVGLAREAFVAGMPAIIEDMLSEREIENAEDGFCLQFSTAPFPGHQRAMHLVESEGGGNWYVTQDQHGSEQEGWLCPALFKYYDEAPETIYGAALESEEVFRPDSVAFGVNDG